MTGADRPTDTIADGAAGMYPPFDTIAARLLAAPRATSGMPGRSRLRRTATATAIVDATYRTGPAPPTPAATTSVKRITWARKPRTTSGAQPNRTWARWATRPPVNDPIASPAAIAYRMNMAGRLSSPGTPRAAGPRAARPGGRDAVRLTTRSSRRSPDHHRVGRRDSPGPARSRDRGGRPAGLRPRSLPRRP